MYFTRDFRCDHSILTDSQSGVARLMWYARDMISSAEDEQGRQIDTGGRKRTSHTAVASAGTS